MAMLLAFNGFLGLHVPELNAVQTRCRHDTDPKKGLRRQQVWHLKSKAKWIQTTEKMAFENGSVWASNATRHRIGEELVENEVHNELNAVLNAGRNGSG